MDFRLRHHINFSFYNYQLDEYQFIFDYCHRNYRLLFEIPRKSFYRNHSYCFLTLLDHLPMLNLFEILKTFITTEDLLKKGNVLNEYISCDNKGEVFDKFM